MAEAVAASGGCPRTESIINVKFALEVAHGLVLVGEPRAEVAAFNPHEEEKQVLNDGQLLQLHGQAGQA
jgi:hypothetical protein